MLENVCFNEDSREVDWDASQITENTRAAYPLEFMGERWAAALVASGQSQLCSAEQQHLSRRVRVVSLSAKPPFASGLAANARIPCLGGHPRNAVLLCCDLFGVLPPVCRLSLHQALYFFIGGFTAKMAGTEQGVSQPEATFSACYTSTSLVWHPVRLKHACVCMYVCAHQWGMSSSCDGKKLQAGWKIHPVLLFL